GANVTPVQALNALKATAVPVDGIAGGRIDVLAAARALGILAAPTPTAPAAGAPTTRQAQLVRGTFARTLRKTVGIASAGPLTVVLTRANARTCDMTLRSGGAVYLTWRSTATQLDISAPVGRGTYALAVTCRDARTRPYAL